MKNVKVWRNERVPRLLRQQEVELLRDAAAFDAMLYQKGFVAYYMLTRDPLWLRKLESSRTEFSRWIAQPLQPLSANFVACSRSAPATSQRPRSCSASLDRLSRRGWSPATNEGATPLVLRAAT
ncbi:MAG: hypothetical protein RL701_4802 [Pseudomonadota bacterium]